MIARLAGAAFACLLLLPPADSFAQSPELARIDSLVALTRLTEARSALLRWQQAQRARASAEDAAHAFLLRGRLHTDADSALSAYLEVALGYPSSSSAPEALLRLGQAALAQGDADRATGYLERLARDYPAASQRTMGRLWLARAQRARRRPAEACALLDAVARDAGDDALLAALIDTDRQACRTSATANAVPASGTSRNVASAPAGSPSHAIQVGAFRDQSSAHALARRLRERGFDARVVFIGSGTLALVRVGSFPGARDATAVLRRVRELHRDAVLVDDVARERTSR
ncbi:MAG TPA: SPOR domain-containing protein [Longimicrobiales bacterium]|nr:SPOR domain-containing protein [Longimicrobiales bacterium]